MWLFNVLRCPHGHWTVPKLAFVAAQGIIPADSDELKAGKAEIFNTIRRNRYASVPQPKRITRPPKSLFRSLRLKLFPKRVDTGV
jgi:hypothetical protein